MASSSQVDRTRVGLTAAALLLVSVILLFVPVSSAAELWQGVFVRSGLMLGAIWLAMPSANRDAAWARISVPQFGAVVLAVFVIARFKIPLRYFIPVVIVLSIAFVMLRPRQLKRPPRN